MTSGQKIAFSLLAAMGLFAAFVLSLRTPIFKELETRYYTQSKIQEYTGQLNKISESCDSYITEILDSIETDWVKTPAVRSYYVQNPSESDVNQRRALTEQLFKKNSALNGIRIVDKNGRNVHYSSYDETDVLKQNGITKVYKNYPDIQKDADELAFEIIEKKTDSMESQLLLDEGRNRLIISVPYCWMEDVYAGQCLFYFRWSDVEKELTARETIPVGQKLTMFADNDFAGGFVYGLPSGNKNQFKEAFEKYWKGEVSQNPEKLLEMEDGRFWVALSSNTACVKISGVYTSDVFELSQEVILLLYICVFITILLIVFLLFSFGRDPEQVLKKRIKKIQYGIIKEYIDKEEKLDWTKLSHQLKNRKKDLSSEILKSLRVHSKKKRKELDAFLEQNWNDIFSIFDDKAGASGVTAASGSTVVSGAGELTGTSLAEIRKVVEEVLKSTKLNVAAVQTVRKAAKPVEEVEEIEAVEELTDDVEEIEEVEELTDDVEDVEAVEELTDDVEEVEEVEELAEDVEEVEDVEELAEDVGDVEDVEELAEDVEEIEEVEELTDDVEDVEDVEELADDVEEIEEVEELAGDVEEVEEVEELADDVEEIEEVEELADDVEDIEEVEELTGDVEDDKEMNNEFDISLLLMNQPNYEYSPADDTYFSSDEFPTVDNIMAEELKLGSHIKNENKSDSKEINFTVFDLNKLPENENVEAVSELLSDIEELVEEIPAVQPYYSMTSFAENLQTDAPVLESAEVEDGAIIEANGVYTISDELELKDVEQNQDFKALVDSVL